MKQLERFIKLLRDNGYSTITNWQTKLDNGYIQCDRIFNKKNGENVIVLFHVYEKDIGFGMYIESKSISFSESFKDIENSLK